MAAQRNGRLTGKKVAFLAADGVEESELVEPWRAVQEAGGTPELVSLQPGEIQAFHHLDKTVKKPVHKTVEDAKPDDYAALVLPGGVANGDFIRGNERAVSFTRTFFKDGKPIGAICHGLWVMAEADVVRGRTVTSWPSLKTDLRNAGATWVDKEVVTDKGLVTSRKPADLPAFCDKLVEEIAEGVHTRQGAGV